MKILHCSVISFFVVILSVACSEQPKSNKPAGMSQQPEQQKAVESVYDTVLKKLEAAPQDVEARYHLGELYYRDGLYEQALDAYRQVIALEPEKGYVYLKMGTALNMLQRYQEAVTAFEKAAAYLKDPAVAYNNLGISFGRMEQYHDEIDALKQALSHRPRYASARYNLGVTYLKIGDPAAASQQYDLLNEIDGTMAAALLREIEANFPASVAPTVKP